MRGLNLAIVALALGLLGAITFTLCMLWDLALPAYAMTRVWELVLPGFRGISLASFALGLVESFLYGVYAGVVFGPIYNWLSRRLEASLATGGMKTCLNGSRRTGSGSSSRWASAGLSCGAARAAGWADTGIGATRRPGQRSSTAATTTSPR